MKTDSITIIGNGTGDVPETFETPIITFNEFKLGAENEIHLTNGKLSGLREKVQFEGHERNPILSHAFGEIEKELTLQLNCKPSIGLTTVVMASTLFEKIYTYRMQFLPRYVRSEALHPRQPLASNFHNWIGERRVALNLSHDQFFWKGLALQKPSTGHDFSDDPFKLLASISKNAEQTLYLLKDIQVEAWLHHATDEKIQSVEPFFFLQRSLKETQNWWLYDQNLSYCVDDIVHKIAWCQQQLISAA